MIKYVFHEDEPIRIKAAGKADPQVIGEALEEISKSKGGELHPEDVVEVARSTRHVLHKHFEWDDTVAAENYRKDQARNLIRIVRVEDEATADGTTRAFHSIHTDGGTSYRHIEQVRSSAEFQLALLKAAERDLDAFGKRYRDLKDVCAIVDQARQAIDRRRSNLETRAAA